MTARHVRVNFGHMTSSSDGGVEVSWCRGNSTRTRLSWYMSASHGSTFILERPVDPFFYASGLWFQHVSKPSYLATHSTNFLFRGCAAQACRHVHAKRLDLSSVRLPGGGAPPRSALRQMLSAHQEAEISFPTPDDVKYLLRFGFTI